MSPGAQYGLLLAMIAATIGLMFMVDRVARARRVVKEAAKDVPFSGGTLHRSPAWARYHIHYYGFALLFLAFDMEMAFMYPWAVVYRELGVMALADMGVFLTILFLGLIYGWREGALGRQ